MITKQFFSKTSKLTAFFSVILLIFTINSCGTTKEVAKDTEPEIVEKPVVKEEKKPEEKKDKPKDQESPDIIFVRELQAFLEKNDIKGAINHFDSLPSELKDDTELKMLLGALLYSDMQYDEAIKIANDVLASNNKNMEALELLSMCNRAKGDKKAYQTSLNQILAADPNNPSANIQKAQDYALTKKYKLAKDCYAKALKGDSSNIDAMLGYAQMSYYTDDLKASQKYFEKVLEIEEDNAQAYAYLGKLAYDDGNYLRAYKYVETALEYDSSNYDYLLDKGTYLRYLGKFDEAHKAWSKAVEVNPSYFLAYAYLAGSYDDLEKWDLALENYLKVIETNPNYFYAYEETAILAYREKDYKNAIKYFQKAAEYSDNYSYTLMTAACYFKLNDSLTAKKILQAKLKKLTPNTTEYDLVRFYNDNYSRNAEVTLKQKIQKETNSNNRGKMLFYIGLYYELNKADDVAKEYYADVTSMQAPMFFEYRIAEWGLQQ